MYISGENIVVKPYTPVDAYAVMPMDAGVASSDVGGGHTITQGVRFIWAYDPDNPNGPPSGFTGQGWFADADGSPIWYSIKFFNMTLEGILSEFAVGGRANLNDVFQNWQNYVDASGSQSRDIVKEFQQKLGWDCWSNVNSDV